MVERHLAKVNVASSNLVFRSIYKRQKTHVFASFVVCFNSINHGAIAKW